MTAPLRRPLRRPSMRRAVILFPSGFTLGNLFFGIFAIIAASRLHFTAAGVYVMLGGICDALDGRVARATNSGTEFGEELDSLVDAISFGLAPAMIMYFAVLNRDGWDWVFVFIFAACAVLRLARFNIEQAGTAKTYFQGLPSPAAGITLASFYWFSQSWLYSYGAVADLPWHVLLRFIMVGLSILMISNVPYPTFPRTGFRSLRAIGATILLVGSVALLASRRLEYFFPIALIYVAWGLARWVFFGLFERRQPTLPYDLSEGEDEEDDEEEFALTDSRVHASKQGYREAVIARPERPRGRLGAPEREEAEPAAPRHDRGPRKPDRTERPERAERPERPAAPERAAEAERPARREKKVERPKRGERPERPERPERGERPARPEAATAPPPASTPAAAASGVGAITLGEPEVERLVADHEESLSLDEGSEMETSGETAGPGAEGAPARKRKRRRRRGERKERGPADASAVPPADATSGGVYAPVPSFDTGGDGGGHAEPPERSPYASAPSAYSPPVPPPETVSPVPAPAPAAAAPTSPPASAPTPSSTSPEPSE